MLCSEFCRLTNKYLKILLTTILFLTSLSAYALLEEVTYNDPKVSDFDIATTSHYFIGQHAVIARTVEELCKLKNGTYVSHTYDDSTKSRAYYYNTSKSRFIYSGGSYPILTSLVCSQEVDTTSNLDQFIIKYTTTASAQSLSILETRFNQIISSLGVSTSGTITLNQISSDRYFDVIGISESMSEANLKQITDALSTDSNIVYAEPDYIATTQLTPNDPSYSQ